MQFHSVLCVNFWSVSVDDVLLEMCKMHNKKTHIILFYSGAKIIILLNKLSFRAYRIQILFRALKTSWALALCLFFLKRPNISIWYISVPVFSLCYFILKHFSWQCHLIFNLFHKFGKLNRDANHWEVDKEHIHNPTALHRTNVANYWEIKKNGRRGEYILHMTRSQML